MTEETESLMEFPCAFALKVMVEVEDGVNEAMLAIVNELVDEDLLLSSLSERPSRAGKYKSLTINFTAKSKPHLDSIYMALSKHKAFRMAL